MNRSLCLIVSLACAVGASAPPSAWAQMTVGSHAADSRIRYLLYVPDQVTRLTGWVGYHVDLEFESDESFVTMGGGDLSALTYDAVSNHLVLKPRAAVIRTNLTVITSKRTYVIEYTVQGGRPDPDTDQLVYSVRFTYSTPPVADSSVTHELAGASAARFQNTNYWYCGSPLLQPVTVSDDGVQTRVRFSPAAELPAIFVEADDGTESLLNYSMEGPDLVIHRLARHFILRRDQTVGCLTNKGFIGSGERLPSGSISPHIHRRTREIAP